VSSDLDGVWFGTSCQGCNSPSQPFVETDQGIGRLDFGFGGDDQTGNGRSTAADRNTFYHLNHVRRVGLKWLPSHSWLNSATHTALTNTNAVCNAVYQGSTIAFYRSGGGCNNTGEISDVIHHEWGHGIDNNTHSGDGGTGEGTADVVAMHLSHSSLVGPGFRTNGDPVRWIDKASSPYGLLTRTELTSVCGGAVHCIGQVFGQTAWDLSQILVAKFGHHTGWRESERLFFTSLPDAGTYVPTAADAIYSAYMFADDPDGNLTNGTPNAAEIYNAFNLHEIARSQYPTSPACARPSQPVLQVDAQCDVFELSWNAVAGATEYQVLRAALRQDTAYVPVAETAAGQTTYTDTEVAPGVDYWYVVMAVNATGCESTVEGPQLARLPDRPILSVDASVADDEPRGNRSGFADPGEEVDLWLTLENVGTAGAQAISGTIVSSTLGVTVLEGSATWPDLAAGASSINSATLRFTTDDQQVACGDRVEFQLVPSDGSSACPGSTSYFSVQLGEPDGQGGFVCDATPACFNQPTFAGVQSVVPGASCGEVALDWPAGTSNCVNAEIRYSVYRSTDPGFEPSAVNRIASGLLATAFDDALLEPGVEQTYVVRAVDSRSGEESNLVRISAAAPSSPDVRAPLFAGALQASPGDVCGSAAIAWLPAIETCSGPVLYDVYRSTDPLFTPGPASLVATTDATSFVDVGLAPGGDLTYVIRARDAVGNGEANDVRVFAPSGGFEESLLTTAFETDNGGWAVVSPNNASAGNWEWGDPEGTAYQSENDASSVGTRAWITGLASNPGNGDLDEGTTTLLSAAYDLSAAVEPVVRYSRWFTNDRGGSPGDPTDAFRIEVSDDDGQTWTLLESVGPGTPLAWVPVELPLPAQIEPTSTVRFRFTAADLGTGSLVEAGIDEFELLDVGQPCSACAAGALTPNQLTVSLAGEDVVLQWVSQPNAATYRPTRRIAKQGELGRLLETAALSWVDAGAAAPGADSFEYLVPAVDPCGNESPRLGIDIPVP
jgi:hypothetical protein